MDLERFPLENEDFNGILIRLMEEAAEVQQAAAKCLRFGASALYPLGHGIPNYNYVASEIHDFLIVAHEFQRRLSEFTE